MADSDYRAWVEVVPEFSQFNQQVQAGVVGGMAGAGSAGSNAMGGALIAGVGKFALPLVAAIGALGIGSSIADQIRTGVDAGIAYVTSSVQAGSDYNESLNAISVSYGEFASEIDRLSQSSATDLGLSRLDFNAIATQFSAFAKTIQQDNPVGFIDDLSSRGADFASVYNLEVAEALRLFQSGLAGETEPLRRFGIDLSAATVAGYAYANGIAEQGKQLTETQRQQAAYLALMDQTSLVQGDFANTSDQVANRQRILNAQWADAQAQLGMQLLPVLQEILTFVSDELMPAWIEFNEQLGPELAAALEEAWPEIRRLIQEVLPVMVELLPIVIDHLTWLIQQFAGVAANVATVVQNFSDFFSLLSGDITLQEFAERMREGSGTLFDFGNGITNFVAGAIATFQSFASGVKIAVDSAIASVASIPSRAVAAVGNLAGTLIGAGQSLIQGFIDGVNSKIGAIGATFAGVMDFVAGFFPRSPAKYGAFAGSGWTDLLASGRATWDQWASGFASASSGADLMSGLSAPTLATSLVSGQSDDESFLAGGVSRIEVPVYLDGYLIARAVRAFDDALK